MSHFTRHARVALLLCVATAAHAATDTPADYSHALPLTVSGKNAVVQLRLPPAVYLNARGAALDDLRLFDANGKPMPFALINQTPQTQAVRGEQAVRIFPVPAGDGQAAKVSGNVEIKTAPDGAVTSITTRYENQGKTAAAGLGALILDLRQNQAVAISALRFQLPPGTGNYDAGIELEVSDDLRSWQTIGFGKLSWLSNANRDTLSNDRIDFSPRAFRYARLSWTEGTPLQFAKIIAETRQTSAAAAATDSITIKPRAGRFENDLVYEAAIAIPVARLGLQFSEKNIVLPAVLGAYRELPTPKGDKSTRWDFQPALRATFFQLDQAGVVRGGGDLMLDGRHHAQWVLRPDTPSASKPELRLTWVPATMVFVAGGPAPFSLRFGRDKATSAARDIAQVAPGFGDAELRQLEQASAGQVAMVQAPVAGRGEAEVAGEKARGKVILLWGALLLGVAVLGFMAWKLIAQMKEPA